MKEPGKLFYALGKFDDFAESARLKSCDLESWVTLVYRYFRAARARARESLSDKEDGAI